MDYSSQSARFLAKRQMSSRDAKTSTIAPVRVNNRTLSSSHKKNSYHLALLPAHTERNGVQHQKPKNLVLYSQFRVVELLTHISVPENPSFERAHFALKALALIAEDTRIYKHEIRSIVNELEHSIFLPTKRLNEETFNRIVEVYPESGKNEKIPFFSLYSYLLNREYTVFQENHRLTIENKTFRAKTRHNRALEQQLLEKADFNITVAKQVKFDTFLNELRTRIIKLETQNKKMKESLQSHSSAISEKNLAISELKVAHSKQGGDIEKLSTKAATKEECITGLELDIMHSKKNCERLSNENRQMKLLITEQGRLLNDYDKRFEEVADIIHTGMRDEDNANFTESSKERLILLLNTLKQHQIPSSPIRTKRRSFTITCKQSVNH